jgi:hypothetical protein
MRLEAKAVEALKFNLWLTNPFPRTSPRVNKHNPTVITTDGRRMKFKEAQ